jgi:hypothetical protein
MAMAGLNNIKLRAIAEGEDHAALEGGPPAMTATG